MKANFLVLSCFIPNICVYTVILWPLKNEFFLTIYNSFLEKIPSEISNFHENGGISYF